MLAQDEPRQAIISLSEACQRMLTLDGAAVAVMNMARHWGVVHATSALAASLEDAGYAIGEGPPLDAFTTHRPVLADDLAGSQGGRWPAYAKAAKAAGCASVFAFPLELGAIAIGTLTFYSARATSLSSAQLAVVRTSTHPIAQALVADLDELLATPPRNPADAGFVRAEVHQAAGMIKVQLQISVDDAMARLRAYTYAHDESINDVARAVVTKRLRFTVDTE